MWIVVGALGLSFPEESLLKSPEPSLFKALHEMFLGKGLNRRVLYYVFPVVAFVSLYSILPHKVCVCVGFVLYAHRRACIFERNC